MAGSRKDRWPTRSRQTRRDPVGVRRSPLLVALAAMLLCLASPALGQTDATDPQATAAPATSPVTLTVEPLLGGAARYGGWAAVRIHVENGGPAIDGELRIQGTERGAARYAIPVQLATGARQEHVLYGRVVFGSRFTVDLLDHGTSVASERVALQARDTDTLGVAVVAEHPERLVADVRSSIAARRRLPSTVVAVAPEDLPPRMEAWGAIDRIVWQDIPASRLSTEQLDALVSWVALGGDLVLLGGTTGAAGLEGLPPDLLPYRPAGVVDVPLEDLAAMLGDLPADATSLPAVAGVLDRGSVLGRSGDSVIAARRPVGLGSVTVVGFDPTVTWLSGSALAGTLWGRLLPPESRPDSRWSDPNSLLETALGYVPSISVPRMDQLFLLFLAYVVLIGPVAYLVLRRLDRREWAWVVLPVLAVAFTGASFLLGVVLKGNSVVVNELAIVRGGAGVDRGMAEVHVGVFAPTRGTFDVRLPGGALVSGTQRDEQGGSSLPLDVLQGDPSQVRGLQVGVGDVRGFRAQATVPVPRLETDLALVGDHLQGSVRNASGEALEHVSFAYGGALEVFGRMEAGESRTLDIAPTKNRLTNRSLVTRMFGARTESDPLPVSRVAILRSLSGGFEWEGGQTSDPLAGYGPVVLAWRSGGPLPVDVGTTADLAGDTLYILPVEISAHGAATFAGDAIVPSVLEVVAMDSNVDPSGWYLVQGTMTVSYRPAGLEGTFLPTALRLRMGVPLQAPGLGDRTLAPLPDADQPDQAEPLRSGSPPAAPTSPPRIQLFDVAAGLWVEFEPAGNGVSYGIDDPARFIDPSGNLLVRFVSRNSDTYDQFGLSVGMDGTVA